MTTKTQHWKELKRVYESWKSKIKTKKRIKF
jgi:hypothetical protein